MADDPTLTWTWTDRGNDVTEFRNIIVAQRICQTYKLILDSALALDPALTHERSLALLRSLWYFCLGPLKDVLMVPRGNSAAKANLESHWNVLYLALFRAECTRQGQLAGRQYVRNSLNPRMWVAIQISACSPLELLARICWKRAAFTSLGQYAARLQTLIVRTAPGSTMGIPRVIFVCTGHPAPNPGARFVVAESVSHWGTLTTMDKWSIKSRIKRFERLPAAAWQHVKAKTDAFHDRVIQIYNNDPTRTPIDRDDLSVVPPVLRTELRYARLSAVRAMGPANYFNHGGEAAVPFHTPNFSYKHRCFKCRGIFRYNITPVTVEADQLIPFFNDHCFPDWSCGEVLCHSLCRAATGGAVGN